MNLSSAGLDAAVFGLPDVELLRHINLCEVLLGAQLLQIIVKLHLRHHQLKTETMRRN